MLSLAGGAIGIALGFGVVVWRHARHAVVRGRDAVGGGDVVRRRGGDRRVLRLLPGAQGRAAESDRRAAVRVIWSADRSGRSGRSDFVRVVRALRRREPPWMRARRPSAQKCQRPDNQLRSQMPRLTYIGAAFRRPRGGNDPWIVFEKLCVTSRNRRGDGRLAPWRSSRRAAPGAARGRWALADLAAAASRRASRSVSST